MPTVIRGETIQLVQDRNSGATFEDAILEDCHFFGCTLGWTDSPATRTHVRSVKLRDCTVHTNCVVYPAVVEDVVVDGCTKRGGAGHVAIWGAALRHVSLRGRLAPFNLAEYSLFDESQKRFVPSLEFREGNVRFYGEVDWALDITEALFPEVELVGVPGDLVRFDGRTAALVRRRNANEQMQRFERQREQYAGFELTVLAMLRGPYDSVVLVASLLAPKKRRQEELDALQRLRDEGIADPA